MPVQPANFNSVNSHYGMPTQPTSLQYANYVPNPMPNPQQFPPTPQQFPPTPQQFPPTPQPFFNPQPSPITVPPTTLPNPATSSDGSDLNRMLQVQTLMLEIHRLESESREGNQQRLQELKQRVGELSGTGGIMQGPDSLPPPPAYDGKQSIGRPEYGAPGRV